MWKTKASIAALIGSFAASGCNSAGPLSSSRDGMAPVLRGYVVGIGATSSRSNVVAYSGAAAGTLLVSVQEAPSISVKVDDDGEFTLRGLPSGSFTVIFKQDGVVIGTQQFTAVLPNQELTVTVELVDGEIVLLDERRTGIGHGDIELEGDITRVMNVSTSGDSRLEIDGKTVIVRPGVTSIREGNTARTVRDLEDGMQVHVKGVWIEGSATDVLAHSIVIQDDVEDGPSGTSEGKATICHMPPGNPANRKTLEIGASAVPAHLAHGDAMGPCAGSEAPRNNGGGNGGDKGNKGGNGKGGKK
jgi:hypothetical protein